MQHQHIHNIPSSTSAEIYQVNSKKWTCTCLAFKHNHISKTCKHISMVKAALEKPQPETGVVEEPKGETDGEGAAPFSLSKVQVQQLLEYDRWTKTRLSQNFMLRDFLYSSRADFLGMSNKADDPDAVIAAGHALCEKVCEPLLKKFGRFAVTYGYQSRTLIETGYKKAKANSSAPHQWDRGTFGKAIYARIDVSLYSVEDGKHSKYDVGRWIMSNLDIDLLMLWATSNVMCITISPKPRRVFMEWVKYGSGDNGTNSLTYMGQDYWQNVWPNLPESKRPAFGPSATGGSMKWWE